MKKANAQDSAAKKCISPHAEISVLRRCELVLSSPCERRWSRVCTHWFSAPYPVTNVFDLTDSDLA
jgi:hypothetical protein